jgi:hypothetical protein
MVKSVELVPVPLDVVTEILPVVAPLGTIAVICVSESTLKVESVPLNFTLLAPVKVLPVITTFAPGAPLVGLKLVILGVTLKLATLVPVPAGFVTVILPVVAPVGTVALIDVDELMVNAAETPLKFTALAVSKLVPVILTTVPTGPELTSELVIVGAPATASSQVVATRIPSTRTVGAALELP